MITSDHVWNRREVGDEAREEAVGDSFTRANQRVVGREVRGEREVS